MSNMDTYLLALQSMGVGIIQFCGHPDGTVAIYGSLCLIRHSRQVFTHASPQTPATIDDGTHCAIGRCLDCYRATAVVSTPSREVIK